MLPNSLIDGNAKFSSHRKELVKVVRLSSPDKYVYEVCSQIDFLIIHWFQR